MPHLFIEGLEELHYENGMRFIAFRIRSREKKNYLQRMTNDGIQIVSGAALAAYTWKSNFHLIWPLGFSAMVIEGVVHFFKNMRKCVRNLSYRQIERICAASFLATGTITYFASVVAFSRTLKQNNLVWIPYLGCAAIGYYISVSSNNRLGRTVLNRKPVFKCFQLLFGPMLIFSAAYYLLILQKHDKEWLRCLPLIVSAAVANSISYSGCRRVESNNEPRWLLFKGLELLVGGSIICINGAVLAIYAVNNHFHPLLIIFFSTMILNGVTDISHSLESFQGCVEMEAPIFYCICNMIRGPIIFFSAFLSARFVDNIMMFPVFLIIAGTGLSLLGYAVMDLYDLVPRPVFNRYCQRVLGPVTIVYGSLISTYIGYRMGWRFSLAVIPFIPIGIYNTYRGWE